jgi:hypothetical protein
MFLSAREKSAKSSVLDELSKHLDKFGSNRIKSRKPVAAEVSVTEMEPKEDLLSVMDEAGHEGVEEAEEKLFPQEEAAEEQAEMGGVDDETKQMIATLYKKFCC